MADPSPYEPAIAGNDQSAQQKIVEGLASTTLYEAPNGRHLSLREIMVDYLILRDGPMSAAGLSVVVDDAMSALERVAEIAIVRLRDG